MARLEAGTLADLVTAVRRLRRITDQHPTLKPVAQELLELNGPLPSLNGSYKRIGTAISTPRSDERAPTPTITPARRRKLSLAAKRRWARAKRAGKNTIGGGAKG